MSEIEKLINSLSDSELEYLEETIFSDNNELIDQEEFEKILEQERLAEAQNNAIQYALKLNLNSVYGVQIMSHFKFADEWQILGASTTLTGRILAKYGLIETIEQFFNPERESRFEFPLLENIIVAADDDDFYDNVETQKLRSAVISDTDSVTGDATLLTDLFGEITFEELEKKATHIEKKENKEFYFFDKPIKVTNYINNQVQFDEVEYLYAHDVEKDIYEIELEDGKIIKVTEDHSIMVCDENGEPTIKKKPTELTTNDFCIVQN